MQKFEGIKNVSNKIKKKISLQPLKKMRTFFSFMCQNFMVRVNHTITHKHTKHFYFCFVSKCFPSRILEPSSQGLISMQYIVFWILLLKTFFPHLSIFINLLMQFLFISECHNDETNLSNDCKIKIYHVPKWGKFS